jgi:hypothetical protein
MICKSFLPPINVVESRGISGFCFSWKQQDLEGINIIRTIQIKDTQTLLFLKQIYKDFVALTNLKFKNKYLCP